MFAAGKVWAEFVLNTVWASAPSSPSVAALIPTTFKESKATIVLSAPFSATWTVNCLGVVKWLEGIENTPVSLSYMLSPLLWSPLPLLKLPVVPSSINLNLGCVKFFVEAVKVILPLGVGLEPELLYITALLSAVNVTTFASVPAAPAVPALDFAIV